MKRGASGRRNTEAGFTLVELLVTISILGIIGFALTESVILGFRTTDGTAANVSRSVATRAAASFFTEDAQRAETVSTTDPACVTTEPGVFLHLGWVEQGVRRSVSYALDPPAGEEQELVRWSCAEGGSPSRKFLGHFTHDAGGPSPVTVTCDPAPCPGVPQDAGTTITLKIQTDPSPAPQPPSELIVRRRTA